MNAQRPMNTACSSLELRFLFKQTFPLDSLPILSAPRTNPDSAPARWAHTSNVGFRRKHNTLRRMRPR